MTTSDELRQRLRGYIAGEMCDPDDLEEGRFGYEWLVDDAAKIAEQWAGEREAALRTALEAVLAGHPGAHEKDSSWSDACDTCQQPWPCPVATCRALLGEGTPERRPEAALRTAAQAVLNDFYAPDRTVHDAWGFTFGRQRSLAALDAALRDVLGGPS